MRSFCKSRFDSGIGIVLALTTVCLVGSASAGGYLAVDNTGQPYKWGGPITLNLDKGPLGKLTKSQADALTIEAVDQWTSKTVPGSAVQFIRGADLSEDHGDQQGSDPNWDYNPPYDGLTAVIYDQTGYYTEQLGAGLSSSVVGFAGPILPDDLSPAPITEGLIVMNGKFESGSASDLPLNIYRGAITHEIGHLLNLDHSQAGIPFSETGYDVGSIGGPYDPRFPPDYSGVPTMFPAVLEGIDTLETDDKAWITNLYPDAETASRGSISGTILDFGGAPVDGINVVAFSVDDPTTMVTCVSGFTDASPTTAPTGTYLIPSLPTDSKWVLDVEPVVGAFTGGSSVGPIDPPAQLPGAPEYLNEPSIESSSDSAVVSTTFNISDNPAEKDINNVDLRFNDINDADIVSEVDTGVDENTGQLVPVTPGRYTFINGVADPDEPGAHDYFPYGLYGDFYRVKCPAGVELDQVFISSQGSFLDVQLLELNDETDFLPLNGTVSSFGFSSLGVSLDSSRMGDEERRGVFVFAVGFTDPFLNGSDPKEITPYTLGLLFSVCDRDGLAVSGTDSGAINPDSGTIRIKGRGFKDVGGAPLVSFSTPGIGVNGVTYVDANTLDVAVSKLSGFTPGMTTMQVANQDESGGYAGRIMQKTQGTAAHVTDWNLY